MHNEFTLTHFMLQFKSVVHFQMCFSLKYNKKKLPCSFEFHILFHHFHLNATLGNILFSRTLVYTGVTERLVCPPIPFSALPVGVCSIEFLCS